MSTNPSANGGALEYLMVIWSVLRETPSTFGPSGLPRTCTLIISGVVLIIDVVSNASSTPVVSLEFVFFLMLCFHCNYSSCAYNN